MAITYNDWVNMDPQKHNIEIFTRHVWEVISKVEGREFPTFLIKCPGYEPEEFTFIGSESEGKLAIVDKNKEFDYYLNHSKTMIIPK